MEQGSLAGLPLSKTAALREPHPVRWDPHRWGDSASSSKEVHMSVITRRRPLRPVGLGPAPRIRIAGGGGMSVGPWRAISVAHDRFALTRWPRRHLDGA